MTAAIRTLDLPEALDAAAAPSLADSLRGARGKPLALSAATVRKLGGQCVQVMLSAAASWRADGQSLSLIEPSREFVEALRLMGLTPEHLTAGEDKA
jgi:chemotaxis protein CheX